MAAWLQAAAVAAALMGRPGDRPSPTVHQIKRDRHVTNGFRDPTGASVPVKAIVNSLAGRDGLRTKAKPDLGSRLVRCAPRIWISEGEIAGASFAKRLRMRKVKGAERLCRLENSSH